MAEAGQKKLVVIGDVTVDWIFARARTSRAIFDGALFDPQLYAQAYKQISGAPLIGEIVQSASLDPKSVGYYDPGNDKEFFPNLEPGSTPFWHAYFLLSRFPDKPTKKWKDAKKWAWRLEAQIGLDRRLKETAFPRDAKCDSCLDSADIIVVNDDHQGFWPNSNLANQLRSKTNFNDVWMLVKLTRPVFQRAANVDARVNGPSEFVDFASEICPNRLIVVVSVDDLRLTGTLINADLSWERTIEDVTQQVLRLQELKQYRHFVVSLYNEGALLFSRNADGRLQQVTLFYDLQSTDRRWPEDSNGMMRGYTQCLVSGIALQLLRAQSIDDISPGVRAGLDAGRVLHENGFEYDGQREGSLIFPENLGFPMTAVVNRLKKSYEADDAESSFTAQVVPIDSRGGRVKADFTILRHLYSDEALLLRHARNVVEWGVNDDEWDVPIARFDDLVVIDRPEIDALLAIRSLIGGYLSSEGRTTPLSIAVFGPPGTGKSFTIKSIANSLSKTGKERDLVFNLSQFTKPEQIYQALHQVRDEGLSGRVPLVFWDEFDSRYDGTDLGWLRYFLAPMHDGTFQEGVVTHNIGRAIFVFAGGTKKSMDAFQKTVRKARRVKGPDFLSRLQGYVDIPSLDMGAKLDPGIVMRRAFLLRSCIQRATRHITYFVESEHHAFEEKPDAERPASSSPESPWAENGHEPKSPRERINVDLGVVNAFLQIPAFRYGARSMEAIVKMSSLKGREMFDRSSLPPLSQLSMHVDADSFMALVTGRHESTT